MTERRPHPFDIVFGEIAPARFPSIREALGERLDLDAFLLAHPAIELLHDLRPDEGLGAAIDDFVRFVHAAFRFWVAGQSTIELDTAATRGLCAEVSRDAVPGLPSGSSTRSAMYIQVAPRLIWAQPVAGGPFEPLDGWFDVPAADTRHVVGCLGVHPDRPGLSVITVALPAQREAARDDGTPIFSPTMPGGDAAGLHSLSSAEELALLAARASVLTEVG